MKRTLVPAVIVAALAAVNWTGLAGGQASAKTNLLVRVPADAKLYFNDSLTSQTGETRTFVTPPLQAGTTYNYTLKAAIVRDGQTLSQTKEVTFKGGQDVEVDFTSLGDKPAAEDGPPPDNGWPRKIVGV